MFQTSLLVHAVIHGLKNYNNKQNKNNYSSRLIKGVLVYECINLVDPHTVINS